MTEIVVTEKPKKPKPKPKAKARAKVVVNGEPVVGVETTPPITTTPITTTPITTTPVTTTPVTTAAPAVVAGDMEPFLQGLRDNGATEDQVRRARMGTYAERMKVADEIWAANQQPPPEVVTTTTTEAPPVVETAPPAASLEDYFRGVDIINAGGTLTPGSPEAIAVDKAIRDTYAGDTDAFLRAVSTTEPAPDTTTEPVTTEPVTTEVAPTDTTLDAFYRGVDQLIAGNPPAPGSPEAIAIDKAIKDTYGGDIDAFFKAMSIPPSVDPATAAPPPAQPTLRETIRTKAGEVISGLGIEDRAIEEKARLELVRESAQRGREQLGRIFAIDPGGLSGGAQRQFELFEADVSRQRVAAQVGLTTERFSRALANLEALTGAEVALGELGLQERGQIEAERVAKEEERFRREEAIGRVQAASGIYTPTIAERAITEEERSSKAEEKLAADRIAIEEGRLEETVRSTLVSEAEARAILTGVLVTEDITLESMGVAIEDFMRPDGSGALDEDKLYMSKEIERVQGDFLAKYGRELTTEEVDSLIRGEAVRAEQVTQQSKEFRASLEQRANEFQLEYDRVTEEFTTRFGLSRDEFEETKRQFDEGIDIQDDRLKEEFRQFNRTIFQAEHEFRENNILDHLRQTLDKNTAEANQAVQRARETGTFIDPETGDTEATLTSRQFYLDRQRAISAETGRFSSMINLKDDFGIDTAEFMTVNEDGSMFAHNLDRYFEVADTLSSNFTTLFGRTPTQLELNRLVEGHEVPIVSMSLAGKRMDLDEGRDEFDQKLQEAESRGYWLDPSGQYQTSTLSKQMANDARDAETARINLGLEELTERGRQFDATKTQRDEEFLITSGLDQDQFDEAKDQYTRSMEARADEFASNLGLEREVFLQSVKEFRAGTLGLVEGARDVTAQSLGIDIDRLINLRSLEAAGRLGNISLESFLSPSILNDYVKADGSIDRHDLLFREMERVQEEFTARYGRAFTNEEVVSLLSGEGIEAPGTDELPELEARILDDIRAALPGATEEQLQQVSTGGTVNVDTMVSLEGRRISEAARQFDQELLLRRTEDRTRVLAITTDEALDRIKYGLEDDRLAQSKELFGKEMDQRIAEWSDTNGLNSEQAAAVKADMEGRLKLSQDQLEQEFIEFAARNQLDLAELTGQTAIGGVITAEELGIPTGIPMMADGKTMDLDAFVERVGLLQEAFELATGQELSHKDAEAMMEGEGIEVEGLPTLAAKSLAATVTSQQMRLAADVSKIAREHDLNVSAFERSIVESNRAFKEASKQAAIDNGLDEARFAQAITAWEAQDVNAKAALRMNLSEITGLMTGEGEITPEELGVTQEGLYKPVFEQITLESLGLHELAETRGGGGLKLFADARESLDPPGVAKDGTKRRFDWTYFAQAEDDPHPGVWDAAMRIVQEAAFDKYGISISQEQAQELTGDTEGKRSVNWRDLEEAGTIAADRVSHGLQTAEFNNLTNRSIEGPPIPGKQGERDEEVLAEKIRQYQEAFFLATGQELSFERAEESLAPKRPEMRPDTWIKSKNHLRSMAVKGLVSYRTRDGAIVEGSNPTDPNANVLGNLADMDAQWDADPDYQVAYPFGSEPSQEYWEPAPSIGISVTELPTMAAKQIAATFGLQLDQFNTAKSQFDANFDAQLSSVARNFKMDEEQHNAAISAARARSGHMQTFMHDLISQFDPTGVWQTDELTAITNLLNGGSMGWASPERGGSSWQAIASIAGSLAPVALSLLKD